MKKPPPGFCSTLPGIPDWPPPLEEPPHADKAAAIQAARPVTAGKRPHERGTETREDTMAIESEDSLEGTLTSLSVTALDNQLPKTRQDTNGIPL